MGDNGRNGQAEAEEEAAQVNILPVFDSLDLYIGELARRGARPATRRTYRRDLAGFLDRARVAYVHELTPNHYERDLDRWTNSSPSTLASRVSVRKGYSAWLKERGHVDTHVAESLRRPRRPRYEDIDVVSVTSEDVGRMLAACEDWQEFLCLSTAVYLGARRNALALVRRGDIDLVRGTVRFANEKGGKVQVKPLPREYQEIIVAAERHGIWSSGEDYLIPNRRPASVRRKERSDKIVWETVRRVAKRCGVRAHVHSLRAAFAVAFDEAHPAEVTALRDLLGHARLETTLIYLRRRDKARGMESVRDLSWGGGPVIGFSSEAIKAHTGFEPVLPEDALCFDVRRKLGTLTDSGVIRPART